MAGQLNRPCETPAKVPNGGDLIHIMDALTSIANDPRASQEDCGEGKIAMDTFVKKFEIFRRLFTGYQHDFRKAEAAVPADADGYFAFAGALVAHHARYGNPVYVSTLLKLVDAMISRWRNTDDPILAARLCAAIESEASIVAQWERHVERSLS